MCNIKPIRTAAEFDAAVERIEVLMNSAPGSPEGAELDLLGDLALIYEYRNDPDPVPEGRAIIAFWIEAKGGTLPGVNELLDGRGDIEEILAGKQPLTPEIAEILHRQLRIPVSALLRVAEQAPRPGFVSEIPTVARIIARYG